MEWGTAEAQAKRLDTDDELASFRAQFYRPPGQIYLDGNSLGLLSLPAEQALLALVHQWKTLGIAGWTEAQPPWFFLAETLAEQMAPLVGARPDEVIVTNSTTVNLHQLVATLFQADASRSKILADALAFPSDIHALESQLRLQNLDPAAHLVRVPSRDGMTLDETDIATAMTPDIQIAVLPSVVYTSGQLLDMARVSEEARRRGVLIGWDCSHSIGAVPHALNAWDADFAFWCGYKYLNGGPGAAGGLYLNRRHFDRSPGLAGWFGARKDKQFDMAHRLEPAWGAGGLQIGTPNILSMAPLQGSLEMIAHAGLARIRQKSLRLTDYLMALADTQLAPHGFAFATPRPAHRRGGHVSLRHPHAVGICKALRRDGVVCDFRPPDSIRLAPVALYTAFVDCWEAVRRLKQIMDERCYEGTTERGLVP